MYTKTGVLCCGVHTAYHRTGLRSQVSGVISTTLVIRSIRCQTHCRPFYLLEKDLQHFIFADRITVS